LSCVYPDESGKTASRLVKTKDQGFIIDGEKWNWTSGTGTGLNGVWMTSQKTGKEFVAYEATIQLGYGFSDSNPEPMIVFRGRAYVPCS
jgi:hypothetical protein